MNPQDMGPWVHLAHTVPSASGLLGALPELEILLGIFLELGKDVERLFGIVPSLFPQLP